jgi:putative ABC transport system permease protein
MIKNYFKTAWRSLVRNKSYAAINVVGLAIGIAACLLVFLLVNFETSFDNFHPNKEHIYRVVSIAHGDDGVHIQGSVPLPTAEGLRMDFPQLKQVATIFQDGNSHFTVGDDSQGHTPKIFKEDDAYIVDPQFFNIFKFGWLAGDKKTALVEPNTIVLTRDEADRFFGSWQNAMGKNIKLEKKVNFKVTGILDNPPENTDFHLKVVMSQASMNVKGNDLFYGNLKDWVSIFGGHYVFVVLPDGVGVNQFNVNLTAFVKKHKPAEYVKDGMQLQALADMHYNTDVELFHNDGFSHQLINIISLIGLFLLIIACVNFVNLATAQAVNRSKEVGIRKVLGSNRKQLITQFICETLIITLFAVVLATGIAWLALPYLNNLLNLKLSSEFLSKPDVLFFLAGTLVGVTFLAGFYPAIVLSGFNPIAALKNRMSSGKTNGVTLRRALVVFQFCIAQILVIGTLVIINQMDYFKNKSLGYAKDAVINVPFPNDSIGHTHMNTLRDELLQQPGVKDVSYSFASPSDNTGWNSDLKFNNSPKKTNFYASMIWADASYFSLYKMQFLAGGPYAKSDSITKYVVNEAFLKKVGIRDPKDAIGKNINFWDNPKMAARIGGVVKDFNTSSLKHEIPPLVLASLSEDYSIINIKIQPSNVKQTLSSIEHLWTNTFPGNLYEYQFLDDKIAGFYNSEEQLSALYKIFAGIAIFISCLGLFGLISFMAVQRTKEVGIRKTLGASVSNIVYLFSKEFTILVIVAFGLSVPIGWYLMNKWLDNFTYKITIGPGIFILAIIVSVVIAWITVGYKAITAALANPVKSLRSE